MENQNSQIECQQVFNINERILIPKGKERRVKVNIENFSQYPYNTIGWIQSREKAFNIKREDNYRMKSFSTGFLIFKDHILTSSHNLIDLDDKSGEVKEHQPQIFTIKYPDTTREMVLLKKYNKIQKYKTNFKFCKIIKDMSKLKKMWFQQKNKNKKLQLQNEIKKLDASSIQHDFALLKLKQSHQSSKHFELQQPNLSSKAKLTVTGYISNSGHSFSLLTHSNSFDSISGKGIFYDIDTTMGQSGSPVYTEEQNKLVGIHKAYSAHKKLNFATIITTPLIQILNQWVKQLKPKGGDINEQQITIKNFNKLMEIGNQFRNKIQMNEALNYYNIMLNLAQRLKGKESLECGKSFSCIGWVYRYKDKLQESLYYYTNELNIYKNIEICDSIQKANALTNISILYSKQDMKKQAIQYYDQADEIYKMLGTQSIQCPYTLHSIGLMYASQKILQQALILYNKALTIYEKIGIQSIGWANTFSSIGQVYSKKGDLKRAAEQYMKALPINNKINKNSPQCAKIQYKIGSCYHIKDLNQLGFQCIQLQQATLEYQIEYIQLQPGYL